MKRGWDKRGLTLSEEIIWLLVQAVGALLLILMLFSYIDSAVQGGLLAQRFYPGNFGLLTTVVAESQDSMVMGDMVGSFGKTIFTFKAGNGILEVVSTTIKAPSRFWVFTPKAVGLADTSISPATGVVHAMREGNVVSLRKDATWHNALLTCPQVVTQKGNALALRHGIIVMRDGRTGAVVVDPTLDALAALIKARLPQSVIAVAPEQVSAVDGVVIALRVDPQLDERNRLVAYYNDAATPETQLRSRKLGCTVLNKLMAGPLGPSIDGIAVVPGASSISKDVPGIELVVGNLGAKDQILTKTVDIQKAIVDGVSGYYE